MSSRRDGPSIGAFISNWTTFEGPARTKLRLALKNYGLRFARRSNCCGNHGEPGC